MPKVVRQESVSSLYVNLYQVHGQAFVAKLHSKKKMFLDVLAGCDAVT